MYDCVICGNPAVPNSNQKEINAQRLFLIWEQSISLSFCQAFSLDVSFQDTVRNSEYCDICRAFIREVDLLWLCLRRMKDNLKNIYNKLRECISQNYANLSDEDSSEVPKEYMDTVAAFYNVFFDEAHNNAAQARLNRLRMAEQIGSRPRSKGRNPVTNHGNQSPMNLDDDLEILCCKVELDENPDNPRYDEFEVNPLSKVEEVETIVEIGSRRDPNRRKKRENSDYIFFKTEDCGDNSSDEDWMEEPNVEPKPVKTKNLLETVRTTNLKAKPKKWRKKRNRRERIRMQCSVSKCSYICYSQIDLEGHVNGIHKGDPNPFHCDICPKKFSTSSKYWGHQAAHRHLKIEPSPAPPVLVKEAALKRGRPKKDEKLSPSPPKLLASVTLNEDSPEPRIGSLKKKVGKSQDKVTCGYGGCSFTCNAKNFLESHINGAHKDDLQPYKCQDCDRIFARISGYWEHRCVYGTATLKMASLKAETARKPKRDKSKKSSNRNKIVRPGIQCCYETCNTVCHLPIMMEAHINRDHNGDPNPFHCKLCEKKFTTISSYWGHGSQHPVKRPKPSEGILSNDHDQVSETRNLRERKSEPEPIQNTTLKATRLQTRKQASEPDLTCPIEGCSFLFKSQFHLDAHVNGEHNGDLFPYHCKALGCDAKFNSSASLWGHTGFHCTPQERIKETSDKIEIYPCSHCGKEFKKKYNLKVHINYVHPLGSEVRCSFCKKLFVGNQAEALTNHEELHQAKLLTDPFACVLCDTICTNSISLKFHVLETHEDTLAGNKCTHCGRVFVSAIKLRMHIRSRHTERPSQFKCKLCSYHAYDGSRLKQHMLTHKQEREITCQHCGKQYKRMRALVYHLRTCVTEIRDAVCKICSKAFVSTTALKRHEESHNRIKAYVCDTCGKAFAAKESLRQHLQVHKDVRVYYGKRYRNRVSGRSTPVSAKKSIAAVKRLRESGSRQQWNEMSDSNKSLPAVDHYNYTPVVGNPNESRLNFAIADPRDLQQLPPNQFITPLLDLSHPLIPHQANPQFWPPKPSYQF